jgi:hypothetical protein
MERRTLGPRLRGDDGMRWNSSRFALPLRAYIIPKPKSPLRTHETPPLKTCPLGFNLSPWQKQHDFETRNLSPWQKQDVLWLTKFVKSCKSRHLTAPGLANLKCDRVAIR